MYLVQMNFAMQQPIILVCESVLRVFECALREIFERWCEITGLRLDALGRVVADTNGLGYVAKHAYGPNADTLYDRNSFKNVVTRDPIGRTVSIKDNEGNQTKFFYELKTDGTEHDSVAYPDGTWEVAVTDKGGRTIQKLDKRGVTQSFIYGNDWSADTVRYEMATKPTLEINYARNAKGQVEKIERTEGGVLVAKTEYTFDDAGRMLSQKQTVGADVKTTGYAYDMARRSVTMTLPDGTTRTKVLDERGRLDSVYLDGTMVADYFYDNNKHTGTRLGNGIEATYGRDVAGRLTSMAYGKNGQDPILRHDLGWDVAGQLKWTKKVPETIADERYGMDNQGQLTEWKTGTLNATNEILTPVDSLGWAMDSRGNWLSTTSHKQTADTRTHSGANAINVRNGVNFTYDDAGNLLSDGVNTYEWTLDGLLAKVTNGSGEITSYQFDGQRRMVKREQKNSSGTTVDASTYLWSGWQLDQEVRNNIPRTFAYGNYIDDQIAMKTAGSLYYMHRSYNQTTEAVTDAGGNLVERYVETTPYGGYAIQDANGNALLTSGIGNRSVFQGAPMTDPMTNLVYLRNRWLSPELGRFVSKDPAKDGDNYYLLEGNMVHSHVDHLGLNIDDPYMNDEKGFDGGVFFFGGFTAGLTVSETRKLCCNDLSKHSRTVDVNAHIGFGSGLGGGIETPVGTFDIQSIGNLLDFSFNFKLSQNCDGTSNTKKCFDMSALNGNSTSMSLLFGHESVNRNVVSWRICFELSGSGVVYKKYRCGGKRNSEKTIRPFPLTDQISSQSDSENCSEVP